MLENSKIYVAGHQGMVGSAIVRALQERGYNNLLLRTHNELDLTRQQTVEDFFAKERPEYVFLAAAKVGGIKANSDYPAQFFYANIMIETNVIHSSYLYGVKKLMFLGSSCIYPKLSSQPIKEEALLTGSLEETNEAYALAKIGGLKMCDYYRVEYGCDFVSVMPTNLYGLGDNYDLEYSHVLPALLRRFHEARERGDNSVVLWGSGSALREFMYADDMADATLFCMFHYSSVGHINIGSGEEVSIKSLADKISHVVGFSGDILWDLSKPDGTPRKLMDSSRLLLLGWSAKTNLNRGIPLAYIDFSDRMI